MYAVSSELVTRLSVNRLPVKLPITDSIFQSLIIDLPTVVQGVRTTWSV